MLKKASFLAVGTTFSMLVFHFFFLWMIPVSDTSFFHAFAMFIRTGVYHWAIPEPYKTIHTGSPPLYSLVLSFVYFFSKGEVVLHLIQILMFVGTLYFIYEILKRYLGKDWSLIITCLFAFIPGNIIYISYVMSDLGAQFLFTLYCFLIYRFFTTKKINYLSISVLIGFITGLWRYSFLIFGVISLLIFMYKHPKRLKNYVFAILGLATIIGWVFIQHNLTGVWGIADDEGIRYNIQMMYMGKSLPSENNPAMKAIRAYIPKNVDLRRPYYELEPYLVPYIGYDYIKMTKMIGDVGRAAMFEHPLVFARVTIESFFTSHFSKPYYNNLDTFGVYNPNVYQLRCDKETGSTIELCRPIIMTKYSYPVWNQFIHISDFYYDTIFRAFNILFLVFLIYAFFSKDRALKVFALLFVIGRLVIAMAAASDNRYVLPFYPLMVIICCLAIREALIKFHFVRPNKPILESGIPL